MKLVINTRNFAIHNRPRERLIMRILPLALAASVVLAGCSSLPSPKNLAKSGNWEQLGLQDGQQGFDQRRPAQLSELAAADNQAVTQYRAGYRNGIQKFCTEDNAFSAGLSGRNYNGQCSFSPMEDAIRANWENGLDEYYAMQEEMDD